MGRAKKLCEGLFIFILFSFQAFGQGYVLNMYHFNLQYVAGSEKAMRAGVEKSLEPLLDFYLAHPDWKASFEMQAEYIEYLAENYPKVLAKLKKLAREGQAEMVSFHYSDQLILGFPRLDQKRSLRLTKEVFEQYDIPLSRVIFTQEAQFGEGVCALGKDWGYEVAVITTNQYDWFHDDPGIPYFDCRGLKVLKAENPDMPLEKIKSEEYSGLRVKWYFLGDGEIVVTGGISPYFSFLFKPRDTIIKRMGADFKKLEQEGYKIATVSEYVEALKQNNIQPRPLKPILDAPWRPEDDQGVWTWMGKYVSPWEDDYGVRTENWRARSWLISAERAGISWEQLRTVWKHQLDAEVSDSTGWFPFKVEINYSKEKSQEVIEEVQRLCPECQAEDKSLELAEKFERISEDDFPVGVKVLGATNLAQKFYRVQGIDGLYALEISFKAGRDARVSFPFTGSKIIYSPAMLEAELVKIDLSQIKPPLHYVGLPNGLIGLDEGLWLIRDNRAGMVASGIDPENKEVHFRVKGARGRDFFFRFYILQGPDEPALRFANQLNQTDGDKVWTMTSH